MNMHNPPHPGEFIKEVYLLPFNISSRTVAEKLLVSPSTFNRLVNAESNISPEMALRLSKTLGRSPESWLSMQDSYNLWHARNNIDLRKVKKLNIKAAEQGVQIGLFTRGAIASLLKIRLTITLCM